MVKIAEEAAAELCHANKVIRHNVAVEFDAACPALFAHDDLVAACKEALRVIDTGAATAETDGPTGEMLRAALAKASA